MRYLNRIATLAVLLAVSACAQITLVNADKPASLGNGVTVMPQRQWNQISSDHILWTADGPTVDALHFFTGIKSGKPLMRVPGVNDKDQTVFDSKMLADDIQDLLVGTLGKQGFQNVRAGSLAPCPFGDDKGFCFGLDFASADGLELKGLALAHKKADTLDLFLFEAPQEYYYDALSPDVRKIFTSVQSK